MKLRSIATIVILGLLASVVVARKGPDPRAARAAARAEPAAHAARLLRAGPAHPTAPDALRLEGQVTDAAQRSVGGVIVELGARRTMTDVDGTFAFEDLAAGDYALTAERGELYGEASVALDATSDAVHIVIAAAPTLVVHVIDPTGVALAGAHVESVERAAITDHAGMARLRGVELFDVIHVTAPGRAEVRFDVVSEDPSEIIDRTVTLGPAAAVGGVVIDPSGAPVASARVEVSFAGQSGIATATTDDRGRWHIDDLGAGKHVVTASSARFIAAKDQVFDHDGVRPREDLIVRVEIGGELAVSVVDPTRAPVAGATVSCDGNTATTDDQGRAMLTGLDFGACSASAVTQTGASHEANVVIARGARASVELVVLRASLAGVIVDAYGTPVAEVSVIASSPTYDGKIGLTDERGAFDLGGVVPGNYELTVRRDQHDVLPPVVVAAEDRNIRLVIPNAAAVTGRVVFDGKPIPYFGVVTSADPGTVDYATPTPVRDASGRFEVRELAPGTWGAVIVAPGFVRRDVTAKQVAAGATVDFGDIVLDRGRLLRGRVVDRNGRRIADAHVTVSPHVEADGASLSAALFGQASARSDRNGEFELAGLPADIDGKHVRASSAGGGVSAARELRDDDADVERHRADRHARRDGREHGAEADVRDRVAGRRRDDDLLRDDRCRGRVRVRAAPRG